MGVKVYLFIIKNQHSFPPKSYNPGVQNVYCSTACMTAFVLHGPQYWVPYVHAGSVPITAYGPLQSPRPEGSYMSELTMRAKPWKKPYQQLKIPQAIRPAYRRQGIPKAPKIQGRCQEVSQHCIPINLNS